MSCSIRQMLADDTLQCAGGALAVIYAELRAIGIAEVKFGQIAMQVLFVAVLVHTVHAALEYREKTFGGIGVNVAANVFLLLVVDGFVAGKIAADLAVVGGFVGH